MPPTLAPSAQSLSIIKTLVAFNTVSEHSNLPLIEWVKQYLSDHGVASRLSYDSTRRKANLFATLGGQGSEKSGGLILSGHTDTVPVTGQAWATPPFEAVLSSSEDRLYGRGTADMKSFIGVCLALVPSIVAQHRGAPLHLALSFDEETTMLGVRSLIADLRDAGITPAGCIIGEPTDMAAVVGHKGRRHVRCCVRGKAAHSSLPLDGVNAIEYAAKIVVYLRELGQRHRMSEPRHFGYAVPYSTVQTTMVLGGLSANTIPAECAFDFEFRHLPWTDAAALQAEVQAFAQTQVLPEMLQQFVDCNITFTTAAVLPAFGAASATEGLDDGTAAVLARMNRTGQPLGYVGFGTEASWFQDAGIPTVICGPGSIDQAHKPNEFIALSQIAQCEAFIRSLMVL